MSKLKKLLILTILCFTLIGSKCDDQSINRNCSSGPCSDTQTQSVPEPGTFVLIGLGLLSLAMIKRIRRKNGL